MGHGGCVGVSVDCSHQPVDTSEVGTANACAAFDVVSELGGGIVGPGQIHLVATDRGGDQVGRISWRQEQDR